MNVFSLFAAVVYAAETIISPLADEHIFTYVQPIRNAPTVSFASLYEIAMRDSKILGVATPAASIPTRTTRKKSYTITIVGDSMVDTLGPDGGGLDKALNALYPHTTFTIINHGVGAENIDSGLHRLTNSYSYLGAARDSVISQRPDIIVIESFGYNPYPLPDITDALNKHWLKLAEMKDTIQRELPDTNIIIAATIAPNWNVFGDGAPFVNMSPEGKRTKVEEIKKYIEGAIGFAKSQRIPLADAYHASLDGAGNGKIGYINAGDHIHYSESGRLLVAQKISETIITNRLLE